MGELAAHVQQEREKNFTCLERQRRQFIYLHTNSSIKLLKRGFLQKMISSIYKQNTLKYLFSVGKKRSLKLLMYGWLYFCTAIQAYIHDYVQTKTQMGNLYWKTILPTFFFFFFLRWFESCRNTNQTKENNHNVFTQWRDSWCGVVER